ncbi:MAG: hypothetical protein DRN25_07105 [Thermoplasmata archaeon]|nr:MAG: hypothetical protein DRN25_07105 [Thermoplasmata archaeon]
MLKGMVLVAIATSFIAVYVAVTQVMVKETSNFISEQSRLIGKMAKGEISEGEYAKESEKLEKSYRKTMAEKISPLIFEIKKVLKLINETNITGVENLSKQLENVTEVLK